MRAAASWGTAGNQKIAKYVGQMKQADVSKRSQKKTKTKKVFRPYSQCYKIGFEKKGT